MNKALDKFFARIKKLNTSRDDVLVLISILANIMFRNPKFYPIGAATLSKFLSLIDSDDEQIKIINSIINKFKILPNDSDFAEIWLYQARHSRPHHYIPKAQQWLHPALPLAIRLDHQINSTTRQTKIREFQAQCTKLLAETKSDV